jgi:hypothetical protein
MIDGLRFHPMIGCGSHAVRCRMNPEAALPTRLSGRVRALPLLFAVGCTWVTAAEVKDKLGELDDDGDGAPNAFDCAPASAAEGTADEIPYDGLDNDCTDGDAVDLDGDGWPGIRRSDWERVRDAAGGSATWRLAEEDAVDCDDTRADVHPQAVEVFYDGTRASCETRHDFDADGDGFISAAWEGTPALAAYAASDPAAIGAPGDCDDARADVFPGAPETPYDAVDADCGEDNDYDADRDGWVPEAWWEAFLAWRQRPGNETIEAGRGDCLDADAVVAGATAVDADPCGAISRLVGSQVAAALVHPGACDAPRDGVDSDCAGDDDFDADADGYFPAEFAEPRATFAAAWSLSLTTVVGDCRDDDPSIRPDAEERWRDGVDQDCFGGDLVPAVTWLDARLDQPGPPTIRSHAEGHTLLVLSESATGTGWTAPTPSALGWALTATSPPAPWSHQPATLGVDTLGPIASVADGSTVQALTAAQVGGDAGVSLIPWLWDETAGPTPLLPFPDAAARVAGAPSLPQAFANVDLWDAPDGRRWWLACREGELLAVTTPAGSPSTPRRVSLTPTTGACATEDCALGSTCALIPDDDRLFAAACDDAHCDLFELSANGAAPPTLRLDERASWSAATLRRTGTDRDRAVTGVAPGGGLVYSDPFDGLETSTLLSDLDITAVAGVYHDAELVIAFTTRDAAASRLHLGVVDTARDTATTFVWAEASPGATWALDLEDSGDRWLLAVVLTEPGGGTVGFASAAW